MKFYYFITCYYMLINCYIYKNIHSYYVNYYLLVFLYQRELGMASYVQAYKLYVMPLSRGR